MVRMTRILVVAAALGLAVFCLWHPAPPPIASTAPPSSRPEPFAGRQKGSHRGNQAAASSDPVVYVAGAVLHPGVYRLRAGDRAGDAVRAAGGTVAVAQPWSVNLAAPLRDGDEIYVPQRGEQAARPAAKRTRRSRASPEPAGDIDVNRADAAAIGSVPGIGRAVAARIVELREREGPYASLDELLDVGGMTAARLERARPFLRPP
jgi:competence protein ComEA